MASRYVILLFGRINIYIAHYWNHIMIRTATKDRNAIPAKEGELIKESRIRRRTGKPRRINVLMEPDVFGELKEKSGRYVILPKGVRIVNALRSLLDMYVGKPLGFEEVFLPKIAHLEIFRKAGILGRWDRYLMAVKPFSDLQSDGGGYLLDPLQCTSFYEFHEGKVIDTDAGPVRWCDCSGPTYRYEDSDRIAPLIKQREFHRFEFMYAGTQRQVIRIRERCLSRLERLCADLGLGYRIVVGAGCYQIRKNGGKPPQTQDEIPIKDLEIYCPGYGYLEAAGCAVLGTTLTSRFGIRSRNGEKMWSGCTGIGLERMVYALVANYGSEAMPGAMMGLMK
jgi:seryl-tRNA synthetase